MANPFILGSTVMQAANDTQKEFKEYAYDFTKNSFIYNADGTHQLVTRNEAIKIWVYKTLLTERYLYRAYFDDYGAEIEHFIGAVPNDDKEAGNLYRYIEEALLVNPYITNVNNINVVQTGKIIKLHLEITTVYGKSTLEIEV